MVNLGHTEHAHTAHTHNHLAEWKIHCLVYADLCDECVGVVTYVGPTNDQMKIIAKLHDTHTPTETTSLSLLSTLELD